MPISFYGLILWFLSGGAVECVVVPCTLSLMAKGERLSNLGERLLEHIWERLSSFER